MRLTELLNIQYPIIQAPMAGGATTPELVAAVSNAGGLGSIGAGYLTPVALEAHIKATKRLTDKPFSVNVFIPEETECSASAQNAMCEYLNQIACHFNIQVTPTTPPYAVDLEAQLDVLIAENIPIVSSTFGVFNQAQCTRLRDTILIGTATHLEEAKYIEQSGYHAIVAQSIEAGGHRGTFLGEVNKGLQGHFALIPNLVDTIHLPIIAAGSIMDKRSVRAASVLGASGVQLGTAFLTCKESGIPEVYKEALLATEYDNTTLTTHFSGKAARGIDNLFIRSMKKTKALPYPIQNKLTQLIRKTATSQENTEYMSLWAGQAAYLCQRQTVKELIESLLI